MFGFARSRRAAKPAALEELSLKGVARYILSGRCRRVGVLTGAGVSCAAGIPDFRSPGGMYDTLRPELLTATEEQRRMMQLDPTAVVSTHIFRDNQYPYLEVRRPFILGLADHTWKASAAHFFFQLLHSHGKLHTLFTQNIDGLDFQTDVPLDKIVSVHGTMGTAHCEACGAAMEMGEFQRLVRENIKDIYGQDASAPAASSPVPCGQCGKAQMKPSTVLYGSSLPRSFFTAMERADELDLLLVAGTSLTVSPANSVPHAVGEECVRVVVNREKVGEDLGLNYESADVFLGGECDAIIVELCAELGWLEELASLAPRMCDASAQLVQQRFQQSTSDC